MIKLRALNKLDLQKTLKWHNSKEISEYYLGHPFPINEEMESLWYEKVLTSNFPTTVFGVEHEDDQILIGITVLKNINLINRSAELALYIGDKKYKGKGYSKVITTKTIEFGFYQLNLNRIYLKVLSTNNTAIGLYQNLGFIKEGEFRQSVFKNNEFLNESLYSILKKEYRNEL